MPTIEIKRLSLAVSLFAISCSPSLPSEQILPKDPSPEVEPEKIPTIYTTPTVYASPTLIPITKRQPSIPELTPTASQTSPISPAKSETVLTPPKETVPPGTLWTKEVFAPNGEGPPYFFDRQSAYVFTSKDAMLVLNLKSGQPSWTWQENNLSRFKFYVDQSEPFIFAENQAFEFLGGEKLFARNTHVWTIPWSQSINAFKPPARQTSAQFTITDVGLNFLFSVQGPTTDQYSALVEKGSAKFLWQGEGRIWYINKKLGIIIVQSKSEKVWKTMDVKLGIKIKELTQDTPNVYSIDTTYTDDTTFYASASVGRDNKIVFAVDIKSGNKIWEIGNSKLPGYKDIAKFKGQSADRLYLYYTPQDARGITTAPQLVLLDKKSGGVIWQIEIGKVNVYDFLGEIDNLIILPDIQTNGILIIDALSGKTLKKPNFSVDKLLGVSKDSIIVFSSKKDGGIFGLNKNNGEISWHIKQDIAPSNQQPLPVFSEDKIIFVNSKTKTVNVFSTNGKLLQDIKVIGDARDIKIPLPGFVLIQSESSRKAYLAMVKI